MDKRSPEEVAWRKAIYGLPVSGAVYIQIAATIKAALDHVLAERDTLRARVASALSLVAGRGDSDDVAAILRGEA
jgi:hypothetical protein